MLAGAARLHAESLVDHGGGEVGQAAFDDHAHGGDADGIARRQVAAGDDGDDHRGELVVREWLGDQAAEQVLSRIRPLCGDQRGGVNAEVLPGLCRGGDLVLMDEVLWRLFLQAARPGGRGGRAIASLDS
ncbi:hypothetical protein ACWEPL_64480 [Nonomuraea sp. NPDC004186]|uniref:hypothetical protein n=1 Tax=Nonomuraea sp. NPDC049625 TaxID=3155775 RepID=UPI003439A5F1